MPSFDVVSEVDLHELTNAVGQANREIGNRFDLKGTIAKIEQQERLLIIIGDAEFQIGQILDILQNKLTKRGIDIDCLEFGEIENSITASKQSVTARHGIDKDSARKVVKLIKEAKLKVRVKIQQDQVRVDGKKRDDLQAVMSKLKEAAFDLPFQFTNFRD